LPSSFQDKWEEGGYKTFSDLQTEYKEETERVQEKAEKAFSIKRKIRKVLSKITSNKNRIIRHARDLGSRESGCSEEDIKSSYQRCQRKNVKAKKSRRSNCPKNQSEAKRSCISLAFSEQEGDTDTDKSVKDDMKKILTEDVEEGFDFLRELDVNLQSPGVCCECSVEARGTEVLSRTKRGAGGGGGRDGGDGGDGGDGRDEGDEDEDEGSCGKGVWVKVDDGGPQSFPPSSNFNSSHLLDDDRFNNFFGNEHVDQNNVNALGDKKGKRGKWGEKWVVENTILRRGDLDKAEFSRVRGEDAKASLKRDENGEVKEKWIKYRSEKKLDFINKME